MFLQLPGIKEGLDLLLRFSKISKLYPHHVELLKLF